MTLDKQAMVERLEKVVAENDQRILDAGLLHLADESTIYQLEHSIVPELKAQVEQLALALRDHVDHYQGRNGEPYVVLMVRVSSLLATYEASKSKEQHGTTG